MDAPGPVKNPQRSPAESADADRGHQEGSEEGASLRPLARALLALAEDLLSDEEAP